ASPPRAPRPPRERLRLTVRGSAAHADNMPRARARPETLFLAVTASLGLACGASPYRPEHDITSGISTSSGAASTSGGVTADDTGPGTSSGAPGTTEGSTTHAPIFDVGAGDLPTAQGCRKADFRFVIDGSGSMQF